jgi:hypothetical protein
MRNVVHYTVHYGFSQKFPFPARDVYAWSTDFRADDLPRLGQKGRRKVERIDDATLVLTDTVILGKGQDTKVRLVRLFPDLLMWTNTRLSDVGKYSQFLYRVMPEGDSASRLDFSGAQVDEARSRLSASKLKESARRYAEADAMIWVSLASSMEKELARPASRGASRNPAH